MKILGYNYKIVVKTDDNMEALGHCKYAQLQININEKQCPQQVESTILHEMMHAINYHLYLGLEERHIMGLEAGLYQSLIDNGVDLSPLVKDLQNDQMEQQPASPTVSPKAR